MIEVRLIGHARFGAQRGHAGLRHRSCGQHGGTVVGRHPGWHLDSETEEKLAAVGCPRDRHRDVSHRVFEDQIPPDDPGYKLPQCSVAVGVRRTGDRDQAGELRIAETAETASHGGQENRDRNPGPRRRETASSRGSRSQRQGQKPPPDYHFEGHR